MAVGFGNSSKRKLRPRLTSPAKEIELLNGGSEAVVFPTSLRIMAQEAHDRLLPYGKTLIDAVKF
jgi:hypothetical protein